MDAGASNSVALGHMISPEELQNNFSPVESTQQSESITANKHDFLKFVFPEFTESSVISFPIYFGAGINHHSYPSNSDLGLDAIIELGIAIYSKKKTTIWEDSSVLIKHNSGASPLNDELTIGNPFFVTLKTSPKVFLSN